MNLELHSITNATTVAFEIITEERKWRTEKLLSLHRSLADQKIASAWGKQQQQQKLQQQQQQTHFLAAYSMSNKLLLFARHTLTTGFQKCLKSWHCQLREFTVTPSSTVKKVRTGSKNNQGT